jgi:LmbE family N-acetylglucosaminyl deacetylase
MELPKEAFDNSALVVAHPDDEVLWFSSILAKVSRIVIVFVGPDHRAAIDGHRYRDKIITLDVEQVRSHNLSSWPYPEETEYGLRLSGDADLDDAYRAQAEIVTEKLEAVLEDCKNIFTHNPWGEYGHEAHVQLSKVTSAVAGKRGARVWYNNYVSGKSSRLMRNFMAGFRNDYFTQDVDVERARDIAGTYTQSGTWSFAADYAWFPAECFVCGPLESTSAPKEGTLFPVNYIRVPFDPVAPVAPPPGLLTRVRRKLKRMLSASQRVAAHVATD